MQYWKRALSYSWKAETLDFNLVNQFQGQISPGAPETTGSALPDSVSNTVYVTDAPPNCCAVLEPVNCRLLERETETTSGRRLDAWRVEYRH